MFYLVHKPKGISSFHCIYKLRKTHGIKKIGHTGTLDPLASGLLLVATGNSTKLIPYLEKSTKTYRFTFRLDGWTESGDEWTEIHYFDISLLKQKEKEIHREALEKCIVDNFSGIIEQTPPKHSAIWIEGQRAYKLARKGQDFEMPKRKVKILSHRIVDFNFPQITLEMEVSEGTYVRTIAQDIGKYFWLNAYVTLLERIKLWKLSLPPIADPNIPYVSDPVDYSTIFPHIPCIEITDWDTIRVLKWIKIENVYNGEEWKTALLKNNGSFIALVQEKDWIFKILRNDLR